MKAPKARIFSLWRIVRAMLLLFCAIPLWMACSSLPSPLPAAGEELPTFPTPQPTPTLLPTMQPMPTSTATVPPHSPESPPPLYVLEAEFDYSRHFLQAKQRITLLNPTEKPLEDLLFVVEPNRYPGTFILKSLSIADQELKDKAEWVQINQMRLPLSNAWQPMQTLEVQLEYELNLPSPQPNPATRPVPFGWTPLQTNLVDWYPFIPPYREGIGWLAHRPGYFGEHLVAEVADYEVSIRIRDALTVRTTASPNPTGEPTAGLLTLAASAPAEERDGVFYFSFSKGRSFAWSVSPHYTVSSAQAGEVTLYGYAFAAHRAAGEAALNTTAQAVELYTRLFGAYPHPTLSVVEADFLDGMEYDGLVFLSKGFYNLYQGSPTEYLVAIAAHEAAHQWWYGLVGNDQALEPWLDEALCTYSERLYYEHNAPEALPWWWTYRIDFYQPSGWINGSIYDYTAFPNAYEAYRNAVYLNGAKFLEETRQTIGDEAFFSFLRSYAESNRHQIATGQGFFDLLRSVSSQDLEPLVAKFFR